MPPPARIRRITIDFIPHADQRYPTAGDWTFDDADVADRVAAGLKPGDPIEPNACLRIRVSQTPNQLHEQLVAVHELVEALLCYHRRITPEVVDAFDTGPGAGLAEPGDDMNAPYRDEHCAATGVERTLAATLGVCWETYGEALAALDGADDP